MTVVLIDESGENKQDTIIPVPAPVKKCINKPLGFALIKY